MNNKEIKKIRSITEKKYYIINQYIESYNYYKST